MSTHFSLEDTNPEEFTPHISKSEYDRGVKKYLSVYPYDSSQTFRNPYTGSLIRSEPEYMEYVRDYVYLDLCKKQMNAHYSNTYQSIIDNLLRTHREEMDSQRSTLIYQYDHTLKKYRRWYSICMSVAAVFLCAVLFFYLPSQRDSAYQSGMDSGYSTGYNDGEKEGYINGHESGYSSGFSDGQDASASSESSGQSPGSSSGSSGGSSGQSSGNGSISPDASEIVYVTRTGTKYHRAGCSYLSSSIEMSLKDAIAAGYGPCSRCKP